MGLGSLFVLPTPCRVTFKAISGHVLVRLPLRVSDSSMLKHATLPTHGHSHTAKSSQAAVTSGMDGPGPCSIWGRGEELGGTERRPQTTPCICRNQRAKEGTRCT